jgi:hypothetical protein
VSRLTSTQLHRSPHSTFLVTRLQPKGLVEAKAVEAKAVEAKVAVASVEAVAVAVSSKHPLRHN